MVAAEGRRWVLLLRTRGSTEAEERWVECDQDDRKLQGAMKPTETYGKMARSLGIFRRAIAIPLYDFLRFILRSIASPSPLTSLQTRNLGVEPVI